MTPIRHPDLSRRDISLNVLRLDRVHPRIDGNKWFKLKPNLPAILASDSPVLSFGGAWSNHIRCLAAAGELFGFSSIGLIRGELIEPLNPVLAEARRSGMRLEALSRSDYRRRHDPDFLSALEARFGTALILPEGGSNALAVEGCQEIARYLHWTPGARQRFLLLPAATGATLAGVISGLPPVPRLEVIGVAVLKAAGYLEREVSGYLRSHRPTQPWRIEEGFHCGGYARSNAELDSFIAEFMEQTGLPLEPVYSGKLLLATWQLIQEGVLPPGSEVIVVHTGGLPR